MRDDNHMNSPGRTRGSHKGLDYRHLQYHYLVI